MSEWIEIGRIVAAQGLDGEVRVYPNSDFPERFLEPGQRWLLRPGETEPQPIEFLGGRYIPGKGLYAVQLAGVEDRDDAEALRGCQLLVSADDRPHLEEGEFYVQDLMGLEVFHQVTGELIGTVVDLMPAGNDLLEVELRSQAVFETETEISDPKKQGKKKRPGKGKTILIPFVQEIVPVVDLAGKRIEITPPAGLIE